MKEGSKVFRTSSFISHRNTDIPHLAQERTRLTCPKHHWVFDMGTADCVEIGKKALRLFKHKVEVGRVPTCW